MQIIIGERCLAASGLFGGKEDRVSEIVQGKYYLKTCIIVLRTAEQMPALMPLCRRLVESGIDCKALLSEEMAEPGMGCRCCRWKRQGVPARRRNRGYCF